MASTTVLTPDNFADRFRIMRRVDDAPLASHSRSKYVDTIRPRPHATDRTDVKPAEQYAESEARDDEVSADITKPRTLGYTTISPISLELHEVAAAGNRKSRSALYRATSRSRRLLQSRTLNLMALLVFGFGMYVSVQGFIQNRRVAEGVPTAVQASQEQGAEAPAETKPDDNAMANYQVAPDMPRYISIESQGIKARVLRIGLTGDGAVGTPNNVYDGGWYEGSAKPGEGGVSLIVGHVSGISAPGVFRDIDRLKSGEVISVERGDGTVIRYRVDATESFPANNVDMAKVLSYSKVEGGEALNLITCHGSFDSASRQYTERLVVYTTRI